MYQILKNGEPYELGNHQGVFSSLGKAQEFCNNLQKIKPESAFSVEPVLLFSKQAIEDLKELVQYTIKFECEDFYTKLMLLDDTDSHGWLRPIGDSQDWDEIVRFFEHYSAVLVDPLKMDTASNILEQVAQKTSGHVYCSAVRLVSLLDPMPEFKSNSINDMHAAA